jgi:hypothetical protein
MSIVNIHEVQTVWGYKSVELHHADITQLPNPVDCLLISAFANSYNPREGTVLGYLKKNCNLSMIELLSDAELNLIKPFNIWISKKIPNQNFERIACIEILGSSFSLDNIFKNMVSLFMICENHNIELKTIALPLLGTGNQGLNPEQVLPHLLINTITTLKKVNQLSKIIFVEVNKDKIELLDSAMNDFLKRNKESLQLLPKNSISKPVIEELISNLIKLKSELDAIETINELIFALRSDKARIFELAILGRRLAERIVMDILEEPKLKEELWKSIDRLREKNIAAWIISYLHVLRIFGNLAAHEKSAVTHFPTSISQDDFITFLFSMNRVSDFWLQYNSFRKNSIN